MPNACHRARPQLAPGISRGRVVGVARAQRLLGRALRSGGPRGKEQEPPGGFEPPTPRLRIESSTTELRWRGPNLARCCATRYPTSALRPPRLDPFTHDQGKHRKSSYWIGPPPAEHRVETQTEKSRRREPRTHDCLVRVRPERPAPEAGRQAQLRSSEEGHHDQRAHHEHDPHDALSG